MGAALAAAALLLTAGCGGDDQGGGDVAASPSAAAETSDSAEPTVEPTGDSPAAEPSTAETATEVDPKAFGRSIIDAQLEAGAVHMKATIGQGATMTGVLSYTGDQPAMDMALSGVQTAGGDVHMILVDGVMYIQVPGTAMGDKFLKVDAEDLGDNPMAKSLQSMDLSSSFKAFKALTSLKQVGEDTVAGVQTVHYEATVDTAKSLQAQGIDPNQLGALPPEITYDVWVGEDDLIRKMVLGPAAGSVEMVLTRWGEPVQISAPPPGKVQEMPRR